LCLSGWHWVLENQRILKFCLHYSSKDPFGPAPFEFFFQKTLILAFDTIKSDFPNCTFPQNFRALCIGIYGNSTVLLNISQEGTFPKWDSCILDWIWARSMGFLVEHLQRLMVMIWIEWYTGPEKEILQLIFVLVILCILEPWFVKNTQNN
jgi:hypothetical protein